MIVLERKMQAEKIVPPIGNYTTECQAALNSDGAITLRNYNPENRDEDEIIILSAEETQAIIRLFSRLGNLIAHNNLPF